MTEEASPHEALDLCGLFKFEIRHEHVLHDNVDGLLVDLLASAASLVKAPVEVG